MGHNLKFVMLLKDNTTTIFLSILLKDQLHIRRLSYRETLTLQKQYSV